MARFGFDCDSVWLRRDFVAVGETCYACYLAGVDFMLPFAPLFFCAISSMLGHEAYVFRRPSDYSSWVGAAAGKSCVDKAVAVGARRARYGWLEGLRNAL